MFLEKEKRDSHELICPKNPSPNHPLNPEENFIDRRRKKPISIPKEPINEGQDR